MLNIRTTEFVEIQEVQKEVFQIINHQVEEAKATRQRR